MIHFVPTPLWDIHLGNGVFSPPENTGASGVYEDPIRLWVDFTEQH